MKESRRSILAGILMITFYTNLKRNQFLINHLIHTLAFDVINPGLYYID